MAAPADVSDGEQVAAMFDTVMSTHGTVDVLVNNADSFRRCSISSMPTRRGGGGSST